MTAAEDVPLTNIELRSHADQWLRFEYGISVDGLADLVNASKERDRLAERVNGLEIDLGASKREADAERKEHAVTLASLEEIGKQRDQHLRERDELAAKLTAQSNAAEEPCDVATEARIDATEFVLALNQESGHRLALRRDDLQIRLAVALKLIEALARTAPVSPLRTAAMEFVDQEGEGRL